LATPVSSRARKNREPLYHRRTLTKPCSLVFFTAPSHVPPTTRLITESEKPSPTQPVSLPPSSCVASCQLARIKPKPLTPQVARIPKLVLPIPPPLEGGADDERSESRRRGIRAPERLTHCATGGSSTSAIAQNRLGLRKPPDPIRQSTINIRQSAPPQSSPPPPRATAPPCAAHHDPAAPAFFPSRNPRSASVSPPMFPAGTNRTP
jgi:hypothetical protein